MQTILLTGATGFLGSHLLRALLGHGYKVVMLKRSTSDCWRIKDSLNRVTSCDIDKEPLNSVFEKHNIDCIVHTACHYGREKDSVSEIAEVNIMLGLKLLDHAIVNGIQLFINTDTFFNATPIAPVQRYLGDYILSKRQFVEWLAHKSHEIKVVNLKLQHVYGPDDSSNKFVPWIASQLLENVSEIELADGKQKRDFIYVEDVTSAFIAVMENQLGLPPFSQFDVGTGKLLTVKEFVKMMHDLIGKKRGHADTFLKFGALPLKDGELMSVSVDNRGLVGLSWQPKTSVEAGLIKLIHSMDRSDHD